MSSEGVVTSVSSDDAFSRPGGENSGLGWEDSSFPTVGVVVFSSLVLPTWAFLRVVVGMTDSEGLTKAGAGS